MKASVRSPYGRFWQLLRLSLIHISDGSYQKELLEKWLDSNQIQAEVVICKGYDDMIKKLDADELDALVIPALSVNSDFIAIANIGASDCYFGVSKSLSLIHISGTPLP